MLFRSAKLEEDLAWKMQKQRKWGPGFPTFPPGSPLKTLLKCCQLPCKVYLELTAVQLLTLVVSVMFASIGAGGVPGGSVFLLFMVLENMGLAADQVAMIVALALGINPILDMFETCCNVTGDNVCTYVVGAPKITNK